MPFRQGEFTKQMSRKWGRSPQTYAVDTHPEAIRLAEREREAIELRKRGLTYRAIAEAMDIRDRNGNLLPGTVHKMVTRGLQRWMRESDEELRTLELERLDVLTERLWSVIEGGHDDRAIRAIEKYMQVSERRAKLAGLDAPDKRLVRAELDQRVRVEVVETVAEYLDLVDAVIAEEVEARDTTDTDTDTDTELPALPPAFEEDDE